MSLTGIGKRCPEPPPVIVCLPQIDGGWIDLLEAGAFDVVVEPYPRERIQRVDASPLSFGDGLSRVYQVLLGRYGCGRRLTRENVHLDQRPYLRIDSRFSPVLAGAAFAVVGVIQATCGSDASPSPVSDGLAAESKTRDSDEMILTGSGKTIVVFFSVPISTNV